MANIQGADTIFYGGDIITMDDHNASGKVEAIAIMEGIIVEVGSIDRVFSLKGPQTEVIFLNQQTLMPGFIEPHQHAVMTSQIKFIYTNIGGLNYRSYAEVREVMKTKIQTVLNNPEIDEKWALFFAWDPELILDLPKLSAKFLDEHFSTEVAIGVVAQNGHVAWVNNLAFEKAGITSTVNCTAGGTFVRDEAGSLTGQLHEEPAILRVLNQAPVPGEEELINDVMKQWQSYASAGFTTVTDLLYVPSEGFDQILKTIATRDDCPIRLGLYKLQYPSANETSVSSNKSEQEFMCWCPPLKHIIQELAARQQQEKAAAKATTSAKEDADDESIGFFNDKLWEIGVKLIADGSPHCGTAAVREPYLDTPLTTTLGFQPAPNYGTLLFTTDDYLVTVKKLTKEGKQVAIHCQGERTCEQILEVYEQVLIEDPTNTCRHRMEHVGLMTVDQIARAGKINVALSFFVDQLRFYATVQKTDVLGEDRVNRWTPLSEASKNGITWTIHQDQPCFPGDASPFANMKTAITRTHRDDPTHVYGPEYRVSIDEALKSYTVNAAWQLHLDKQLGTITVGKKADLVVLSENPYHKDPFHLEDIKVVETFLGGRRNKLADLTTITGLQDKVLQRRDQGQ